jgi:hypothetical protein
LHRLGVALHGAACALHAQDGTRREGKRERNLKLKISILNTGFLPLEEKK